MIPTLVSAEELLNFEMVKIINLTNSEKGNLTVADHFILNNHKIGGCRLLKEVRNSRYLDALENLYIHKTRVIV